MSRTTYQVTNLRSGVSIIQFCDVSATPHQITFWPGFLKNAPGASQDDLPTNNAAIRRFLRACIVKPILQDDFEQILAFNMVVKPSVRGAMIQRELDCASELEGITVPVLVTHGRSDTVRWLTTSYGTARARKHHGMTASVMRPFSKNRCALTLN